MIQKAGGYVDGKAWSLSFLFGVIGFV